MPRRSWSGWRSHRAGACAGSASGSARRCSPTSRPESIEFADRVREVIIEPSTRRDARRGRLIVLAGPSGVGKSSLVARLREDLPELFFSVSATTRARRPGEVDGRDYRFLTAADFDALIATGALLEWAEIHAGLHRSGTPRKPVEVALAAGRPVLVEVDLQGARAIKATLPEAVTVFVEPPTFDELTRRLRARDTESQAQFARRLDTARTEMAARDEFDVAVVNDDLTAVVARLVDLLVGRADPAGRTPSSA